MNVLNRFPTSPSLKKYLRPLSGQVTVQALPMKQYTNRFLGDVQLIQRTNTFTSKKNRCLGFNKRLQSFNKQNKNDEKSYCSIKNDTNKQQKIDRKLLSPSRALEYYSKIFKTQKHDAIQKQKRKIKRSSNLQVQRIQLFKKDVILKSRNVLVTQTAFSRNLSKIRTPKVNKTFQIFDKVEVQPWYTEGDFDRADD